MPTVHITETPFQGSIESSLKQAQAAGLISDADLATSLAAAIAAVRAKASKVHVTQSGLVHSTVAALQAVANLPNGSALVIGGSLANIYAAVPGDWSPGFPIGV